MEPISVDEPKAPVKSAPLSTGALAAGLAGTVIGSIAWTCHYEYAPMLFMWTALAGLSGMAAGLLERGTNKASLCLVSSLAVFTGNYVAYMDTFGHGGSFVILLPLTVLALMPTFLAWVLLRKNVSAPKCLLPISVITFVPFPMAIAGASSLVSFSASESLTLIGSVLRDTLLIALGPWTTRIARVWFYPKASDGASLTLALAFTVVLGIVICTVAKRPRQSAYWLIPFAWLLMGWFFIGLGEMYSCGMSTMD
ncbi:MAG: hypothetical protein RBU21_00740 [FCB group bacterium]|jgi:hypothetical protein|nr:hypothetical protein [FCB group bacterium]